MVGIQKTQVILYVRDMGRAVGFYRDVLGFGVVFPEGEDLSGESWVVLEAAGTGVALHGGRSVEVGADTPELSFVVLDLEAALAEVRGNGGEFGDPIEPHPGVVFSVGRDPDGHVVTLKQG